jgi:ketosteroid isomerase-like protein
MTIEDGTQAAVLAANEAFYRAFAGKDFAAMEALWARDTPVACIHPLGELLTVREDIMDTWRGILNNPDQPRVVGASEQVTLVGDLAFVVGREFVAGSAIVVTNIYVRESGEWRMAHHHSSPMVMLVG